jgi:hypothetical protein
VLASIDHHGYLLSLSIPIVWDIIIIIEFSQKS